MKKFASIVLALALTLTFGTAALADTAALSDVKPSDWFYTEVNSMIAAGFIDGYEDGTFKPQRDVSVAEFVTMTAKCLGVETGAEYGHWAGKQMGYAYDNGWLDELDCAWSDFNSPVHRQLAAKILAVALGLELTDEIPYSDSANVGQSYVLYVGALCKAGLFDGFEDNTVRPGDILTRAQAATLIYRAVNSGERLTEAPDGKPFAETVYLAAYDNPNFTVRLSNGAATVDINSIELWTDVADPNSTNPEEAAEGQRRAAITEAMSRTRAIPTTSRVTAAYELPCTSWFPGRDAWAVIATEDGRWYRVDLSGQYNDGVPELTELTALRGQNVTVLTWRTTTVTDGLTTFDGTDYIVAALSGAREVIAWPES